MRFDIDVLTQRIHLRLDEDRYQRLKRHARVQQKSVAAVIREAIDKKLEVDAQEVRLTRQGVGSCT